MTRRQRWAWVGIVTTIVALVLGSLSWTWAQELPHQDIHISGGGGPAIISHGGATRITGYTDAPTTVRATIFDLDLGLNDWPHGPQLLDAASMSSINRLSASTTPMSYYGFELAVFRDRTSYSLPAVGGSRAIRGQEIMMWDAHMPWETPHDAAAWRGLGIYAHIPNDGIGRRLGTGLEIGGNAGWDLPFVVRDTEGNSLFEVRGDGRVFIRGRELNP